MSRLGKKSSNGTSCLIPLTLLVLCGWTVHYKTRPTYFVCKFLTFTEVLGKYSAPTNYSFILRMEDREREMKMSSKLTFSNNGLVNERVHITQNISKWIVQSFMIITSLNSQLPRSTTKSKMLYQWMEAQFQMWQKWNDIKRTNKYI